MYIIIFLNGVSIGESHHYKRERNWVHPAGLVKKLRLPWVIMIVSIPARGQCECMANRKLIPWEGEG